MPRTETVRARCRAKLNLVLDIIGRREDGFHEIATVMHPVDLADDVTVTWGEPGIHLETDGLLSPDGPGNIAYRAAERFCGAFGPEPAARITLHKRIPAEAGLAGGSADAGGVLLALAAIHGVESGDPRLAEVARGLGADVPFFLGSGAALAEGIGERLTALPAAGFTAVLALCVPGVNTAWAYGRVKPEHYADSARAARVALDLLRKGRVSELGNGFVPALADERPDIVGMIGRLGRLSGGIAGMTGSGACCFALAPGDGAAEATAEALRAEGFWAWHGPAADRPVTLNTEQPEGAEQ